jgi:TM2 domain-containing membrane protein YozV
MLSKAKDRKVAAVLAFAGVLLPGLHKFYLGRPGWGILYLLLCWTPIPKVASAIEGLWYLFQDREDFERRFNPGLSPNATPVTTPIEPAQVSAVADALRQIEQLRQDGLISEYEFEQKRRQLLDRIG